MENLGFKDYFILIGGVVVLIFYLYRSINIIINKKIKEEKMDLAIGVIAIIGCILILYRYINILLLR